jgi:hypothetical protein
LLLATCLLSFVQAITTTTTTIGFPHKIQSSCYYSTAFLPDCLLAQFCTSNNRDSLQKSKPFGACLLDQITKTDIPFKDQNLLLMLLLAACSDCSNNNNSAPEKLL